ncbi:facilitated trehalose transporter Tret1-like [Epargyreus clarus]|uniref:facilitated trehalose transporter Tret1-like n=1 Tax=Epargyreus clarus TaxID=520877 RepID=UPI003C2B4360
MYTFYFREGSKVNQILCAILINLPAFGYGMSMGWMSPMTLLLQSKDSPKDIPISDGVVSWMAGAAYLTCVPTNFGMAYLGDRLGRKITLMLTSCIGALIWILLLCSLEVWALILARVLVGIIMSGCYVICTVYTKEISEDSIRGALGCMVSLFITTGNLSLYIIGDMLNYPTILWICLAVPLCHLVLFTFMPDSPSYWVKKGDVKEAAKVLAWLRNRREDDIVINQEIGRIIEEQEVKIDKKFLLKNILTDKTLSTAFTIAIVVIVARDVCGAVAVLNFAGEIFTQASSGRKLLLNANQQAMMVGAVQVTGSMLASSVVERAGRKPLLVITSIFGGLTMCMLATWFLIQDYGIIAPAWIPVTTLCLAIFSDSSGLKPIALVLANEIFSFEYRGTVMAVVVSIASLADFLQLLFFKPLAKLIGIYMGFYFFGAVCLFTAVYVFVVVPETKSRTLDQIYEDLNPKSKKKEADWVG